MIEFYQNIIKLQRCTTCSLDYFKCPGHFGHIELSSICFNPITFKLMYKLLNSLCYYCHRFRTSKIQIHHYSAKITLIRAGLLGILFSSLFFLSSPFYFLLINLYYLLTKPLKNSSRSNSTR